jgi:hypothetical protein
LLELLSAADRARPNAEPERPFQGVPVQDRDGVPVDEVRPGRQAIGRPQQEAVVVLDPHGGGHLAVGAGVDQTRGGQIAVERFGERQRDGRRCVPTRDPGAGLASWNAA